MERREARIANRWKLTPEARAEGPYKGYVGIDRISSASKKLSADGRMTNLMHHLSEENLRTAFRSVDGNKACGIDQVTKKEYGKKLETNLASLVDEIKRGGFRPKPAREVLIPKAQGGWRSLAVGCLEDKILQTLLAKILSATFEPIFTEHSYGFRHGKNAHQALAHLYKEISYRDKHCVVVEMDIEKFFDTVDHDRMMELLRLKIGDEKMLRLLRRMLKNSVLEQGGVMKEQGEGTPQGSPVSPVLANIYLHYALDAWFKDTWSEHGSITRYADDAVFVFGDEERAKEFRAALETRLKEFGLHLHPEKSQLRSFKPRSPSGDLPFLGFALYWGRTAGQRSELKAKTLPKRLGRCIQEFKEWIKANRHKHKLDKLWSLARAKILGHYNYYGVSFNVKKLSHFHHACIGLLFRWLNRRSQKRSFTWERFERRLMFHPIPAPSIGAIVVDITSMHGTEPKRKPKSRMRKSRKSGSVRSSGRQRPLFT